jgi:hypothetical protein
VAGYCVKEQDFFEAFPSFRDLLTYYETKKYVIDQDNQAQLGRPDRPEELYEDLEKEVVKNMLLTLADLEMRYPKEGFSKVSHDLYGEVDLTQTWPDISDNLENKSYHLAAQKICSDCDEENKKNFTKRVERYLERNYPQISSADSSVYGLQEELNEIIKNYNRLLDQSPDIAQMYWVEKTSTMPGVLLNSPDFKNYNQDANHRRYSKNCPKKSEHICALDSYWSAKLVSQAKDQLRNQLAKIQDLSDDEKIKPEEKVKKLMRTNPYALSGVLLTKPYYSRLVCDLIKESERD